MIGAPQLVTRAKVLADMLGSDFLLNNEWNDLATDAASALWADITSVNKDFRVNALTFSIASTSSPTVAFPWDFREVRWVRRDPGTSNMKILTKTGQRTAIAQAELSYRIQDQSLYIEPALNSVGSYDLLYVPQPPNFTTDFTVRASLTEQMWNDAGFGSVVAGAGIGKTITADVNGAFPVLEGLTFLVNDRVLVFGTGGALAAKDLGIYRISNLGSAGTKWVLTRATDFDVASATEVRSGVVATATEGTNNAYRPYRLGTFVGPVDTGAQTWTEQVLDAELAPWAEYLILHMAIKALGKEESDEEAATFMALFDPDGTGKRGIRGKVMRWASDQRAADPDQVEDVRGGRRNRGSWPAF